MLIAVAMCETDGAVASAVLGMTRTEPVGFAVLALVVTFAYCTGFTYRSYSNRVTILVGVLCQDARCVFGQSHAHY